MGKALAVAARPAPRLFGILATAAPILAVIRRGPSRWSHLGRFDCDRGIYQPGAWIRANLYPQRCDVSPDGRWFCYATLKGNAHWSVGDTYLAIARLPWLHALCAWRTCGTWTRGAHFVSDRSTCQLGPPATGDSAPCRRRFGLALTPPATFAVERRRGWIESVSSPARSANDPWDERRADSVLLQKPQPVKGSRRLLTVSGRYAAFRAGQPSPTRYALVEDGDERPLEDVQWADWGALGQLLVATDSGRLQVRELRRGRESLRCDIDLAALVPAPTPAPPEAFNW